MKRQTLYNSRSNEKQQALKKMVRVLATKIAQGKAHMSEFLKMNPNQDLKNAFKAEWRRRTF